MVFLSSDCNGKVNVLRLAGNMILLAFIFFSWCSGEILFIAPTFELNIFFCFYLKKMAAPVGVRGGWSLFRGPKETNRVKNNNRPRVLVTLYDYAVATFVSIFCHSNFVLAYYSVFLPPRKKAG